MTKESIKPYTVVVMTTKLPEDFWLINKMADVCHIDGIVFPTGKRYREYGIAYVIKKRFRQLGFLTIANQVLLVLYRLIFERRKDNQAAKEIFNDKPTQHIEKNGIDILEVEDINSAEVRDFIISKEPQLVVVSGAPLLREAIIEAAEGKIINLHPGYAPQYRGRYGCFWPIFNKEPYLVGTTIHFIDKGIDTGSILLQQRVKFNTDDTLRAITYRQHRLGGELMIKCLQQFENLAAKAYQKTDCANKNYIAPGLIHYIKARRWLGKRSRAGKCISSS
jgi:folate-dependent phosphoribosylglycinamide formyltransferase PurN